MNLPLVPLSILYMKNESGRKRTLSVFSYLEFSFHHVAMDNQNFQMSLYAAGSRYADGVIEHDLYYEESGYQFFTSDFAPDGFDCLRGSFLGPYRAERNPLAVESGKCSGSFEKGGNHCGCLMKTLTLRPGEEVRLIFLLGEGGIEAGKTIAMLLPRMFFRTHAGSAFRRSTGSAPGSGRYRMLPPFIFALSARMPMAAFIVTDFPDPDSPTSATVSPLRRIRLTPRMAWTVSPAERKLMSRSLTSRTISAVSAMSYSHSV